MSQFHVQANARFRRRLYGPAGLRAIDAQLASVFPNSTQPPDMRRLHFIKTWADTQRGLMSWAERELGPSYHRLRVEDVYVREAFRGRGLGKLLLARLCHLAVEQDCGRIEWWCLDWNTKAIDFYLKLGAEQMRDWTVYRLNRHTIEQLAAATSTS
jgi:GNAT superfamily N-acetyltransferase